MGIEPNRCVEVGDGFIVFSLLEPTVATVVVGPGVLGIEPNRLIAIGNGFVVLALHAPNRCPSGVRPSAWAPLQFCVEEIESLRDREHVRAVDPTFDRPLFAAHLNHRKPVAADVFDDEDGPLGNNGSRGLSGVQRGVFANHDELIAHLLSGSRRGQRANDHEP